MTNTVKMPRSHNQRLKEIQRQQSYMEDVKEMCLTIGAIFFFLMCLRTIIEAYDWACVTYLENYQLKNELQQEKQAYKAAFVESAMNKKRDSAERERMIKKWQADNPKLAGIFNAR